MILINVGIVGYGLSGRIFHGAVLKTLKDFEEILGDYMFLRTHQSHLININHIVSFEKNEGGYLRMADGSPVPVSKRKRDELMDFFNRI